MTRLFPISNLRIIRCEDTEELFQVNEDNVTVSELKRVLQDAGSVVRR